MLYERLLSVVRGLLPSSPHPAEPLPWGFMRTQACPWHLEPLPASTQPSSLPWSQADIHHARTWKGHLAPIGPPLVLGTILVGKGPLEDLPDVSHVVHTDGIALEHSTAGDRQE